MESWSDRECAASLYGVWVPVDASSLEYLVTKCIGGRVVGLGQG